MGPAADGLVGPTQLQTELIPRVKERVQGTRAEQGVYPSTNRGADALVRGPTPWSGLL